jgi:histidinol-phosphate aminotransferase
MAFDLDKITRENIRRLKPYSSARGEFAGEASVFLDANENAFGSPIAEDFSRYPDPLQRAIKAKLSAMKGVEPEQIFLGNGSDEVIDLLFRIFCLPGIDNTIILPPTYGMYEVSATINDVLVKHVALTEEFDLNIPSIKNAIDEKTKLLFVCSPNNPTGNALDRDRVISLAKIFDGILVVDEAYIDFSSRPSLMSEIDNIPNLVVLQTFSKAWGLAGLRVGMAYADASIIALLNKVKPPYNVNAASQRAVLAALENKAVVERNIAAILDERVRLVESLKKRALTRMVFPSDANFVLVKTTDANAAYRFLLDDGIVVRNRSSVELCEGCLRITVGTPVENAALIDSLRRFEG